MHELRIGAVVWEMKGTEKNGVVNFKAVPHCVEKVNEHSFFCENGCGGSLGIIGKNYFLTRQEAIDHFLKYHGSLEMQLPDLKESDLVGLEHKERTDFQQVEVVRDDSIQKTAVYLGFLDELVNITSKLRWHEEYIAPLYMNVGTLTLTEIYEQVKKMGYGRKIITVFTYSALNGIIYQCSNYIDGKWVKYGTTMGYA